MVILVAERCRSSLRVANAPIVRFLFGLVVCATLTACDTSGPSTCGSTAPQACAIPLGSTVPLDVDDTTAGREDVQSATCGDPVSGPDIAFEWTAPFTGRFDISSAGSAFDTVLSVRSGTCDGEEIACSDDVGEVRQGALTVALDACQTIVIVIEGFAPDDAGAVHLSIRPHEHACSDGLDDDGDGLVDCDDDDCGRDASCFMTGPWPPASAALEQAVLELVNQRRAEGATCGDETFGPAPALENDAALQLAARLHSQDMATQDYFEHTSLDGRTLDDRIEDAGFMGAGPTGENIAAGSETADGVMRGWMDSPGHCANIMSPSFRVIGIGYAFSEASTFGHYWTQDFAASH
jgi:uncharacterized protein YkwD